MHDALARAADRGEVVALDVGRVAPVVARHERDRGRRRPARCVRRPARPAGGAGTSRRPCRRSAIACSTKRWISATIGPVELDRVVLLRLRAVVEQVVVGVVDAADEGERAVDDDELAMQAPEHVEARRRTSGGPDRRRARARRRRSGRSMKSGDRSGRAEAVDHQVDLDAATRRARSAPSRNCAADDVVEQDEGLDDDLALAPCRSPRRRAERTARRSRAARTRLPVGPARGLDRALTARSPRRAARGPTDATRACAAARSARARSALRT